MEISTDTKYLTNKVRFILRQKIVGNDALMTFKIYY
jgi:hypothetical protein